MPRPTEPLRDEHRHLLPHVDQLLTVADSIGEAPLESLRKGVDDAYAFLAHHLIPHARAEEAALYPVVAKVMGAPEATATMSRDHVEIGRLAEELGSLRAEVTGTVTPGLQKALRRILYGLHALVKLHFEKEETVYLPLLDAHLTPEEAHDLFEAMERAALEAHPV